MKCKMNKKTKFNYTEQFDLEFYYEGELGAIYSPENTIFRLWAPTADHVELNFYSAGDGDNLLTTQTMKRSAHGTWIYDAGGDLEGIYYTYVVTVGETLQETVDPYAKAVGVNGKRAMVIHLEKTDPVGFARDKGPALIQNTDAIVCEISVADTTADVSSNAKYPGKFLGLTEEGTVNADGMATGLDHLKELGVTHVQLMPSYDFASIDEADLEGHPYNWGYDPVNYNVPEGSFSTDPFHGEVRIREYKQMVQKLHSENIGVIMDVVFNHTYDIENSCFQNTVPDYFYRKDGEKYSDGSACGNEVASERAMVRKYIVDSVCYWAKEYHLDGFRFDLMGCLDIDTMQEVYDRLHEINPGIIVYGEGWTGGESTLPVKQRALKTNISMLDGVGAFSDDMRDTVRGHVFYDMEQGFVNGAEKLENAIRYSIAGACRHPQVDYADYKYTTTGPWAKNPVDTVNYVSCHDNLTLWDKMNTCCPKESKENLIRMSELAAAIVFTSQGIPFFLQGEEFLRTKPIEGKPGEVSPNSYNLPLYTNSLKYGKLTENREVFEYYKGLIAFRKAHAGLRLGTTEEVCEQLIFADIDIPGVAVFQIHTESEQLFVAYNAGKRAVSIELPEGMPWNVCIKDNKAGTDTMSEQTGKISISKISCFAAYR